MTRSRKVIDFHAPNQNEGNLKLFAMLFYLGVALMLTLGTQLTEQGLWGLSLFLLMYSLFVKQRMHQSMQFAPGKQKRSIFFIVLAAVFVLLLITYKAAAVIALILAGLYWLMVERQGREAPYFLKFHMLTALIFNGLLLLPYLFLNAVILLISHCLLIVQMKVVSGVVGALALFYLPLLMTGLVWGAAIWLSISVLMGRTPYIGFVTNTVRQLS